MQTWMLWIGGGLVLMAMEALAPGAFMLWLGLAALGTGIAAYLGVEGFALHVIVFAIFSSISVSIGLALRRTVRPTGVNAPGSGLVGRSATVLSFNGGEGRVRLGDSDWPARLVEAGPQPSPMEPLEVVAVDGMVLLVRPHQMTQA